MHHRNMFSPIQSPGLLGNSSNTVVASMAQLIGCLIIWVTFRSLCLIHASGQMAGNGTFSSLNTEAQYDVLVCSETSTLINKA